MKNNRKMTILAALAAPVLFNSCAAGFREALIEGGFAFVEETAVEVLQSTIPISQFLEGAGGEEHE